LPISGEIIPISLEISFIDVLFIATMMRDLAYVFLY